MGKSPTPTADNAAPEAIRVKPTVTPATLIGTYSPKEWEEFIDEWVDGFKPPYPHHDRLGGAGDRGRDVVGYLGDPNSDCEWDNYQCKHYPAPLKPSDVWVELGKMCVHTFEKHFRPPRKYRFVAPQGVGITLFDLLRQPEQLRQGLIRNWEKHCQNEVSKSKEYKLEGRLLDYVNEFDFSIFGYVPRNGIIAQHRETKHWYRRFQGEPPSRPADDAPPPAPAVHEAVYVDALLQAYCHHKRIPSLTCFELTTYPPLEQHFRRSRQHFYVAETLHRFSRDQLEPGVFEAIKQQVHDGVADCAEGEHADGFQCVLAVTQLATQLPLAQTLLTPYITPADRRGICHHLANEKRLKWVKI